MESQKHLFSLEDGIHYLNCAYMSPMLKSVEEKGIEGIRSKRNPHHITPTDFFEDSEKLREEFSRLINARESQRIAIVPSASYGLSAVARNINFGEGDEVIVAEGQFPSNYYVWDKKVKEAGGEIISLDAPEEFPKGRAWNEKILKAINRKTKVVALGHVHWADGTLFDLEAIREKLDAVGGYLVIDGTQSVGALPFDVQKIRPDALVCAGYKWLMGPYSIGMAYMGERFDNGEPLEENWISRKDSDNFKELVNYQDQYQPGSMRFDVGERSNFILVPMMLEALKQINHWGVENIYSYCKDLVDPVLGRLSSEGYMIEESKYRSPHLFGLRMINFDPTAFSESLAQKNISVSVRGDAVRVSVNVFNEKADLLALEEVCLEMIN